MDIINPSLFWAITPIAAILYYFFKKEVLEKPSKNEIVLITGCDRGLGFALAMHSLDLGLNVFACCLDIQGEGAKKLESINQSNGDKRIEIIELDLAQQDSINEAATRIKELLNERPYLKLRGLVNNAAIMVFGEFAWQTNLLIKKQIDINYLGTVLFTRAVMPLIRQNQARIITVTSHCGIEPLSGLSIYSGTKAALIAWSTALRVEQAKCNVKVITLVPGSFPTQTGILSLTKEAGKEMKAALEESERKFYNNYFDRFFQFYGAVPILTTTPSKEAAADYLNNFERAMFSTNPKAQYLTETWRYFFYYNAMRWSPVWLRDRLNLKFSCNPPWNGGL